MEEKKVRENQQPNSARQPVKVEEAKKPVNEAKLYCPDQKSRTECHFGKTQLENNDVRHDPYATDDGYIQLFVNQLKTLDPDIIVTDFDSKFA